jgi:hypothetical protein
VDNKPLDLVFFDCHVYEGCLSLFHRLRRAGVITDKTIICIHDTNLWPRPINANCYEIENGWVFAPPERQLANDFKEMGYDVLALGTDMQVHNEKFPYRCGLTIISKFKPNVLKYGSTGPWMVNEKLVSKQYVKVSAYDYVYKGKRADV